MNIILVLLISLLHVILGISCLLILLLSNNIKIIFILLFISIIIKILYIIYGRCILTKHEKNKYFYPIFTYFSEPILYELSNKRREEMIINVFLLVVISKLSILIIFKYYNILIR
jgi:hypothetical protein